MANVMIKDAIESHYRGILEIRREILHEIKGKLRDYVSDNLRDNIGFQHIRIVLVEEFLEGVCGILNDTEKMDLYKEITTLLVGKEIFTKEELGEYITVDVNNDQNKLTCDIRYRGIDTAGRPTIDQPYI